MASGSSTPPKRERFWLVLVFELSGRTAIGANAIRGNAFGSSFT
jgi:hypothetical protein